MTSTDDRSSTAGSGESQGEERPRGGDADLGETVDYQPSSSRDPQRAEALCGALLGDYRLEALIGSGGMGAVYSARTVASVAGLAADAPVAVKVVHGHVLTSAGAHERFLREATLGRDIEHPNVVRTLDCAELEIDGAPLCFLVMEFVEGQTLRELLEELGRIPEQLCRHIAHEVSSGLTAIHAAGAVHRDLKPDNVLITPEHEVKIMDLGVARLTDAAMQLSQTGLFVGSVQYAAPEQFGSMPIDERTDLYSLGVLLFELAAGRHPFPGRDFHEVMRAVCAAAPERLGRANPQLSPFFEELVHCLMAGDPAGRIPTAHELQRVLEAGEESAWWQQRGDAIRAETRRPLRRIRIPRETAVHGRGDELALLHEAFDSAASGEGRVVLVEGEAGIGKSRLVDELVSRLEAGGADVDFLVGGYPPGSVATAASGMGAAIHDYLGGASSAELLARSPALAPAFDALLRGEPAPTEAVRLTPQLVGTCFVHAVRALAARRPTVLLVEDLHFAPEEARAVFAALAQAVRGHRLLLVGTIRPGVPENWLADLSRMEHTLRVPLSRLGPKDLALLLNDRFKSESLARRLAHQIGVKSDGNPFFVFEIIRGLREGKQLVEADDGRWSSSGAIDEIEIPSSVLDLVKARVAELTEEERDVLDVACCWGFEFDPALIGDALGVQRIPLLKRLAQIERRHRLLRAAGRSYVFDHHQVQEALYGSLHEQMREAYHGALANALEARFAAGAASPSRADCVDLSRQFLGAAMADRVLPYIEQALRYLSANVLLREAIELGERVLAIPGLLTSKQRARVLLLLAEPGSPLDRHADRQRQEEFTREAAALAADSGDLELVAEAEAAVSSCLLWVARLDEAAELMLRGIELARARGDRKAEATHSVRLGTLRFQQGRYEESLELLRAGKVIFTEIEWYAGVASALGMLSLVYTNLDRVEEGMRHLEMQLELCTEKGYARTAQAATANLGLQLLGQHRYEESREMLERALRLALELGDRQREAIVLMNIASVWRWLGDLDRARGFVDEAVQLCREIDAVRELGYALQQSALIARDRGDLEAAIEQAEEIRTLWRDRSLPLTAACALLGELYARNGDVERARAALEEAAAAGGRPSAVLQIRAEQACLPGGEVAPALEALAVVRDQGLEPSPATMLRLWEATGDRAYLDEAAALLEHALAGAAEHRHAAIRAASYDHRNVREALESLGEG